MLLLISDNERKSYIYFLKMILHVSIFEQNIAVEVTHIIDFQTYFSYTLC